MSDPSNTEEILAQSKAITEKYTFYKNVIFSPDQIFSIAGLSYDNYPEGSLLFGTGSKWDILRPNKFNQVLTYTSKGLIWQTPNLSFSEGVLPVSKGGTGWSLFPTNGILVNTGKEVLDLIPIPREKKLLSSNSNSLEWTNIDDLALEVSKLFKTLPVKANIVSFEESFPILKLKDRNSSGGMYLSNSGGIFSIGINYTELRDFDSSKASLRLDFNFDDSTIDFKINDNKVLKLNNNGLLENCRLSVDSIDGILPIRNGGLGPLMFDSGDLIVAKNSKELTTLSPRNCEGYFLQIKDGFPSFEPLDKSGFDGKLEVDLILNRSKNSVPPLRFQKNQLIEKSIEGGLEYEGNYLFFTNSKSRQALAYITSDITGKSSNITGVLSISNGGTGCDLSSLGQGQILIRNHENIASFDQGSFGQFLMSQGPGSFPTWKSAILDITTNINSGIDLSYNENIATVKIDQSINFNPIWQGSHKFLNDLVLMNNSTLLLSESDKASVNFGVCSNIKSSNVGDLWFDGSDLIFNKGSEFVKLTSKNSEEFKVVSHYLTVAAGTPVEDNKKLRMKVPVPYLSTSGSLVRANWKLRRLDLVFDEPATTGNAIFNLYCGNKLLLNNAIVNLNKESASFEMFDEIVVSTGEYLQLECVNSESSNYWSAYLLIDLL